MNWIQINKLSICKFRRLYKINLTNFKFLKILIILLCISVYIICQHYTSITKLANEDNLFSEVKVLCWVMTWPENHQKKAQHVKKTWGKRCNKILFMSTMADKDLGIIALPMTEGRNYLWGKTKEAFKYIYENHLNEYDWFLKADDDTYVIVDNLRYMLYTYDPESPWYFGCRFKKFAKQGYMFGGSGYVLSKKSLKLFIEDGLPNEMKCRQDDGGDEDIEMGKCLENVGVIATDSRDSKIMDRFYPFYPYQANVWFWERYYYKPKNIFDCCSDYAISFHYIQPKDMYMFDYLIYHVRPFGIHVNKDVLETARIKIATNSSFVNNAKN